MFFADYHLHSLSPDARVPMEEMCEAAIALGLDEIAVTDHMEMFSPSYVSREGWLFSDEFVQTYFEAVEQCRTKFAGRLTVRAAVELGQPEMNPKRAAWLLTHEFDFVLGSVHKLHDVDLAFKAYTPQTLPALCGENLRMLYTLVDEGDFDILGHIDLIKRYAHRQDILVNLLDYREEVERVLRRVIERGKGIEINTSGLRQPLGQALPGLDILKLYRELGGEIITLGSDAHRPEDIAANFKEARDLALQAGFSRAARFEKRKCSFYEL